MPGRARTDGRVSRVVQRRVSVRRRRPDGGGGGGDANDDSRGWTRARRAPGRDGGGGSRRTRGRRRRRRRVRSVVRRAAGEDGPRHFRGQLRPSRSVRLGARDARRRRSRVVTDTRASRAEAPETAPSSAPETAPSSALETAPSSAPETAPSSAPEAALLSPPAPSGPTRRERMASREPPRAAPRSPASPLDALLAKHLGRAREKTPTGKSDWLERRRRRRRNPFVEDDVAE